MPGSTAPPKPTRAQQQAVSAPPPDDTPSEAAASQPVSPPPAPDPIQQQIEEVQAAIEAVKTSTDPIYLARPSRRMNLIEELTERVAYLKQQQADRAAAAAERARRAEQQATWEALQPQREAIATRWNALREEVRALFADVKALDREHLARTDRKALSEGVEVISLLRASLELAENGRILVRVDHL